MYDLAKYARRAVNKLNNIDVDNQKLPKMKQRWKKRYYSGNICHFMVITLLQHDYSVE